MRPGQRCVLFTLINGVTKLPERLIKQKKNIFIQSFFPNGICLMVLDLVTQIKKGNSTSNFWPNRDYDFTLD